MDILCIMAFVMPEEDLVSFYTRNIFGDVQVITEHIPRDDKNRLGYFINRYMFPKRTVAEKKALKKRHSQKNDRK